MRKKYDPKQDDDNFMYHLMRLVVLWIVIICAIGFDEKTGLLQWLENYISERVSHNEQSIEHDSGGSPQHRI